MRKKTILFIYTIVVCCIVYACQSADERSFSQYETGGKDLYITYCKNCHGANGEGFGALYPPLTDTVFLKHNKAELACLVKNGSKKPITINGKKYDEKMPGFEMLADIDIAKILVYVTNNFGNKQGMYTYQQVAKDLKTCN